MMKLKIMVQGLHADTIGQDLIKRWEHTPDSLRLWRASSNFVYRFEHEGSRYFMRFTHGDDRSSAQIKAELEFMQFLHGQGYPVVIPVQSRRSQWVETMHDTSIGTVHAVVFSQAAGVRLELDKMSEQQLEQWGQSLAALHNESSRYTPPEAGKRMSWEDALALVGSVLEEHPEETDAAGELAKVDTWLRSLSANDPDYGLIHYDFELDNVFWVDGSSPFSAIDFDDAMYHWYAMDIVSAVRDLNVGKEDEHTRSYQLFLNGYQSVRPLNIALLEQFLWFQRFNDLYGFARVLRSVEDCNVSDECPSWFGNLLVKLQRTCENARTKFRNYP